MNQTFKIGKLTLIQDDLGYSIAQDMKNGETEIVASFKHPLDALEYYTKYSMVMAELEPQYYGLTEEDKKEGKDNE